MLTDLEAVEHHWITPLPVQATSWPAYTHAWDTPTGGEPDPPSLRRCYRNTGQCSARQGGGEGHT